MMKLSPTLNLPNVLPVVDIFLNKANVGELLNYGFAAAPNEHDGLKRAVAQIMLAISQANTQSTIEAICIQIVTQPDELFDFANFTHLADIEGLDFKFKDDAKAIVLGIISGLIVNYAAPEWPTDNEVPLPPVPCEMSHDGVRLRSEPSTRFDYTILREINYGQPLKYLNKTITNDEGEKWRLVEMAHSYQSKTIGWIRADYYCHLTDIE